MDCAPFDLQPIIDRLVAQMPTLRKVAGAADYATITKLADFAPPCAYVLLAREKGETNPPGNVSPGAQVRVRQRAIVTFGVVLAVRNYRQQLGAQSNDDLTAIVRGCRAALLGWAPPVDGGHPCMFQQGNLSDYDGATTLWTEVYQTQHFIGVDPS